jgi:hypothetical protein
MLPIDSLDLAGQVVNLTEATGKDPFANGLSPFALSANWRGCMPIKLHS